MDPLHVHEASELGQCMRSLEGSSRKAKDMGSSVLSRPTGSESTKPFGFKRRPRRRALHRAYYRQFELGISGDSIDPELTRSPLSARKHHVRCEPRVERDQVRGTKIGKLVFPLQPPPIAINHLSYNNGLRGFPQIVEYDGGAVDYSDPGQIRKGWIPACSLPPTLPLRRLTWVLPAVAPYDWAPSHLYLGSAHSSSGERAGKSMTVGATCMASSVWRSAGRKRRDDDVGVRKEGRGSVAETRNPS
ncbi:hypothetical protein K488DRAFT_70924 [Vararia minispora EC-137]|uniref:Uncharacterized protein n=1 Tax=Vararia minispora EC-137 TaxID=1314806 RepID=A0ACB8QL43_9AGAM|nr:hypothetical protein K488DRAFT_70924 [Vararia minispora EC-137]